MKKIITTLVALMILTGCSLPGLGGNARNNDIVIAGGNTTERQILSEIVSQMTQHYLPETRVSLINNLGSTLLIYQAMSRKDANISGAMYTGTSLTGELGLPASRDPQDALKQVREGYFERFDMVWFPSYGFANSYAFMVTREFSETHSITKVSQLEELAPSLRAGVDASWMDRKGDGYADFKTQYGFDFGTMYPMEIGLVYNAVQVNEMDVVLGYSTDGRIDGYDLVVLEDDKNLFPPYDASPVLSRAVLEQYPELEPIMLKLEGAIPQETMQQLNQKSDEGKIEPKVVAREFLEEHNYFEDKTVKPLIQRSDYKFLNEKEGE